METAQTLWAALRDRMSAATRSHPGAPLLNSVHFINVFLVLRGTKLGTIF